jgi:hypothetical protein
MSSILANKTAVVQLNLLVIIAFHLLISLFVTVFVLVRIDNSKFQFKNSFYLSANMLLTKHFFALSSFNWLWGCRSATPPDLNKTRTTTFGGGAATFANRSFRVCSLSAHCTFLFKSGASIFWRLIVLRSKYNQPLFATAFA